MSSEYAKELAYHYWSEVSQSADYREGRPKLSSIGYMVDDMPMDCFLEYVAGGRVGSRKAFCEALGISESTISGWIKEGRIPRHARLILGLLMLLDAEEDGHANTSAEWLRAATEDRVIYDGDDILIASFEWGPILNEDGALVEEGSIGVVKARGIESQSDALRLISYQSMLKTLNQVRTILTPAKQRPKDGETADAAVPAVDPKIQEVLDTIDHYKTQYGSTHDA